MSARRCFLFRGQGCILIIHAKERVQNFGIYVPWGCSSRIMQRGGGLRNRNTKRGPSFFYLILLPFICAGHDASTSAAGVGNAHSGGATSCECPHAKHVRWARSSRGLCRHELMGPVLHWHGWRCCRDHGMGGISGVQSRARTPRRPAGL